MEAAGSYDHAPAEDVYHHASHEWNADAADYAGWGQAAAAGSHSGYGDYWAGADGWPASGYATTEGDGQAGGWGEPYGAEAPAPAAGEDYSGYYAGWEGSGSAAGAEGYGAAAAGDQAGYGATAAGAQPYDAYAGYSPYPAEEWAGYDPAWSGSFVADQYGADGSGQHGDQYYGAHNHSPSKGVGKEAKHSAVHHITESDYYAPEEWRGASPKRSGSAPRRPPSRAEPEMAEFESHGQGYYSENPSVGNTSPSSEGRTLGPTPEAGEEGYYFTYEVEGSAPPPASRPPSRGPAEAKAASGKPRPDDATQVAPRSASPPSAPRSASPPAGRPDSPPLPPIVRQPAVVAIAHPPAGKISQRAEIAPPITPASGPVRADSPVFMDPRVDQLLVSNVALGKEVDRLRAETQRLRQENGSLQADLSILDKIILMNNRLKEELEQRKKEGTPPALARRESSEHLRRALQGAAQQEEKLQAELQAMAQQKAALYSQAEQLRRALDEAGKKEAALAAQVQEASRRAESARAKLVQQKEADAKGGAPLNEEQHKLMEVMRRDLHEVRTHANRLMSMNRALSERLRAQKAVTLVQGPDGKKTERLVMGGPDAGANPKDPLPLVLRKEVNRLDEFVRFFLSRGPAAKPSPTPPPPAGAGPPAAKPAGPPPKPKPHAPPAQAPPKPAAAPAGLRPPGVELEVRRPNPDARPAPPPHADRPPRAASPLAGPRGPAGPDPLSPHFLPAARQRSSSPDLVLARPPPPTRPAFTSSPPSPDPHQRSPSSTGRPTRPHAKKGPPRGELNLPYLRREGSVDA